MNRLTLSIGVLIGLIVALADQCDASNDQEKIAELQQALEEGLAKVDPEQKREVEAYVDIAFKTPQDKGFDDRFREAAMAYRQSKGEEANKSEAQRNEIMDFLEDSCRAVMRHLRQFNEMDKTPLIEVAEQSDIDKWRMARKSCRSYLAKCSRRAMELKQRHKYQTYSRLRAAKDFKLVRGL